MGKMNLTVTSLWWTSIVRCYYIAVHFVDGACFHIVALACKRARVRVRDRDR